MESGTVAARIPDEEPAKNEVRGAERDGERPIPVISCEGGCFRGEIARVSANILSEEAPFARVCHGEVLNAPDSSAAAMVKNAENVVVIDGCYLHCHGKLLEAVIAKDKLLHFDALPIYNIGGKYTHIVDINTLPESYRRRLARIVAMNVSTSMKKASNIQQQA